MFAVIALSNVAAFLMLSPEHMANYAKSAASSVLLFSNILFWQEAGYFDLASRLKPLLHLWTLSLEWQFYAAWPLLLMAARRWSPIAIVIAALASFAAGLLWPDPSAVFYLTPFRVFEFAIGALLIWAPMLRRTAAELATLAGLAMIAYAVLQFDGKGFSGAAGLSFSASAPHW